MQSRRIPRILLSVASLVLLGATAAAAGPRSPAVSKPIDTSKQTQGLSPGAVQKILHRGAVWIPCWEMSVVDEKYWNGRRCSAKSSKQWAKLRTAVNLPVTDEDGAKLESIECVVTARHAAKYTFNWSGSGGTGGSASGRVVSEGQGEVGTVTVLMKPEKPVILKPTEDRLHIDAKIKIDGHPKFGLGKERITGCRVTYQVRNPATR